MRKIRNPHAKTFYNRLHELGWTIRDVSGLCGYSEIHIYGLISGSKSAKLARAKVEAAIGITIWGNTGYVRAKIDEDFGSVPKGTAVVIPASTLKVFALVAGGAR